MEMGVSRDKSDGRYPARYTIILVVLVSRDEVEADILEPFIGFGFGK